MRFWILIVIALLMASVIGCTKWEEPQLTPRVQAEKARAAEDITEVSAEDVADEISTEPAEKDVPKPDCDGRLIPTYNFRNEITGYRCDTSAENFECPGHRAGDTWTDDGAECTCLEDGDIECVE